MTRLANLKAAEAATHTTEADRAGASRRVREALDQLGVLLRDGYNFLRGISSFQISQADHIAAFVAYGWEQGEIGLLPDPRVEALANQAAAAPTSLPKRRHGVPGTRGHGSHRLRR